MRILYHSKYWGKISHLPSILNRFTVRSKLMFFTTLLIVVTSIANIYFYYCAFLAIGEYNKMLRDDSNINNLSICLVRGRDALSRYSISKERDDLLIFKKCRMQTLQLAKTIFNASNSLDTYILSRAIQNSLNSYYLEISGMFTSPVDSKAYYARFAKAKTISVYLENYIKQMLDVKLTEGEWHQQKLASHVRMVRSLNIISIITLAIFSFLFVIIISRSITGPLQRLTKFSTTVSQGNFDLEPLPLDSSADVNILALAFNKMVQSIQVMIREITVKSDLERKLHEEEYKNLKIAKQLDEARFLALQSQINPHFLFNTLNTIMRTAMFENADKTSALIVSLANIFRYNLDHKNKDVFLQDELDIVRQYIAIQQVRFGKRIGFELDCPQELKHVIIPRFTIQPLVENAIIHGIGPKEPGGMVRIKINSQAEQVVIKIIDNGIGISKKRIISLASGLDKSAIKGHTTGIGLDNVRERLLLYSKDPHCFQIQSKERWGTVITIRLPRFNKGETDD